MLAEDVNVFNEVFSSDEEINPKDVICSEPDIVPDGIWYHHVQYPHL